MKKNGFTLLELLVVMAVIGILATIVIASYNSAKTKKACEEGDINACMEMDDKDTLDKLIDEKRADNKPVIKEKTNLEYAKEICKDGIDRFEGDPNSTWRSELEVRCK